jgi:hypothetical protein
MGFAIVQSDRLHICFIVETKIDEKAAGCLFGLNKVLWKIRKNIYKFTSSAIMLDCALEYNHFKLPF